MRRLMKRSKNKMKIVYALEDFPKEYSKSIFLAGPTPRDENVVSWRSDAIKALEEAGYDGVVFIPEQQGKTFKDYDVQLEWETEGLNRADCILFWVDRQMRTDFEMIGLTTNVEFGEWFKSGKVVLGFPRDAPKNTYLEKKFKELQLPVSYTLEDTIKNALDLIGEGAERKDGETYVPAYVFNTPMFQSWYKAQTAVGNELRYAKLNYVFTMPKAKKVFMWVLGVHVWIKEEDRIKENEFVLARTDICSAVLYKPAENFLDTEIVTVKEFRSPASNSKAFIYEVPGGSSIKPEDNIDVIHDEIKEELGLDIDKNKLEYINSRQLAGTLSSHKSHLYKLELTKEEMEKLKNDKSTHGVAEDTEMTYIKVMTLKEILDSDILDWTNIGMIMTILNGGY